MTFAQLHPGQFFQVPSPQFFPVRTTFLKTKITRAGGTAFNAVTINHSEDPEVFDETVTFFQPHEEVNVYS